MPAPLLPPSREAIALLPLFAGLQAPQIELVATAADATRVLPLLASERWLGFDTESKPTFVKNEVSTGPHTLQLATLERAWVFQLHDAQCRAVAAQLLAQADVTKVGFGLDGDRTQIRAKLGIEPQSVLDLGIVFRQRGYRQSVGVKTAVAIVFGQRFTKSHKQSTSNWANRMLSEGQLRYAANDAWAAIRVAQALGLVSGAR
ncbi:3'-5' exonuclease [Pseudorhodoferax sp. Leaf267]|uniref:3'-5' exonuclease n=1 Tax=Pseudorhodoferax sp. Leaf267 TaxID=1736316 RepID=UPI0006F2B47C|nr:3'-5' exonuclease [Pseudorhodoferax sp. Leaf267]KQP17946.1 3'-5' exonuclease [Pseudorhodoferax sp. Leaf267]